MSRCVQILAMAILAPLAVDAASAQDRRIGHEEFMRSCAACHGPGGKGDGPVAELLRERPKDLTQIAKENDGGFPLAEGFHAIDGRREIAGHGTSAMPVWGLRFGDQAMLEARGEPGRTASDAQMAAMGRMLSVVYFVQSIQER